MATYPSYPAEQYPQPYAQPAADPYHAAAYAAPAYAPAPAAYGYNPDELRTVFLTGFPDDVKERELNNLLRFLPGYEVSEASAKPDVTSRCLVVGLTCSVSQASQMHWKNSQVWHLYRPFPLLCSLASSGQTINHTCTHCVLIQAQGFALFQHGGAARAAIDNISNLV